MSLNEALNRITKAKDSASKSLDLSGLNLTAIPTQISELTKLNYLNLRENHIVNITNLDKLVNLTKLHLDYNNIDKIQGLESLNNLIELNLAHNEIKEIEGLKSKFELGILYLQNNLITEIKGLDSLKNLFDLSLENNHIIEIKGLESLKNLSNLNLGDNQIQEINGLTNLKHLQSLNLCNNLLNSIENLESLKNLTSLYLHKNQITDIKCLEKLRQLRYFWVFDNRIRALPEYVLNLGFPIIWDIDKGINIIVGKNPFTNPPPEIIKQGNKAIQEYFNQRRKNGTEQLNEAKLILLGDGRAGKTALANRLLNLDLPKESDRTQGLDIVIGKYGFELPDGNEFKINIWDFAGQDKYKTLHQLFYTESSLYVMVAESGNLTTDYDDWFQTAELFGEGSPLILVLNEFKEGIGLGSFDSTYWKKQFPELLKEVLTVNLGTKANLDAAEAIIRFLAITLPHTKYSFPSNWAAIRRILHERRNEQFISLKEYLEICTKNNLPDRASALILSSVLHKVGDCLHYQKSEILKQYIILKNEWATDAVYKILDDKVVAEEKCGFFDLNDVVRIWKSNEYEDMRPQLLELMTQFKLAYQLPGKNEFVTPPLLPPASPVGFVWDELNSLELYIEYEFLPKALLTQFIVTRHADIAQGRTLVWRHGVVLEWKNEAKAVISKTKLEGKDAFRIRSQGANRKGIMTVILKTFRELHSEYKGIKYKEKVPCICEGCKSLKNKQHFFDFEYLRFRLEKGRYKVECEKSLIEINVMELFENSFVLENFKNENIFQLKSEIERVGKQAIKKINLFLASSNELSAERIQIEQAMSRKNKSLKKQEFSIDLLIWEDGKHIGKSMRSQDNYNLEIEQCDFFVMLFYSKVGKYSLEEFNLAHTLFGDKGMPRIQVYQKNIDLPKDLSKADYDSRHEFLELLKEMEHFPDLFDNPHKLVRDLEIAIDKLLEDEDFVKTLKVE